MFKKILFTGLALSLSVSALADVTIDLNDDIELLLVNGSEPEVEGGFFSTNKTVVLPDGENQIAFRYIPIFKNGKDREQLNSDVIVAKFSAADAKLQFEFPHYKNLREAEKFNHNPDWKMVNEKGEQVDLVQDKLIHNGIQIGRNYESEMVTYNAKGGVAAIAPLAVVGSVATPAQLTEPAVANTANTATPSKAPAATTEEEMLRFWYDKADEATKQRFKAYVNSQK